MSDERDIGAIIDEMYAMISGPKGPRDWLRQKGVFHPEARQMRQRRQLRERLAGLVDRRWDMSPGEWVGPSTFGPVPDAVREAASDGPNVIDNAHAFMSVVWSFAPSVVLAPLREQEERLPVDEFVNMLGREFTVPRELVHGRMMEVATFVVSNEKRTVMIAVPTPTALTSPDGDTVAMVDDSELHCNCPCWVAGAFVVSWIEEFSGI